MATFGILLKSYGPDLPYAERFMASYSQYVQGDVPVHAVVPDEDVAAFTAMMTGRGEVLPESLWSEHLVDHPIHGNSPGYINQEVIKLAFYEQGLLENYLCADSEAVFLRPFSEKDFMSDKTTPYTFVTSDAELRVDPSYWQRYGEARDRSLIALRAYLELEPVQPFETCHGFGVLSATVVRSLRMFLDDRNMSYADALQLCPYEFSWYNFWLEKSKVIPRLTREPIFHTVHIESQHLEMALKEIDPDALSRGYVGVVVNSGFSRASGIVDVAEPRPQSLGRYVPLSELARATWERVLRKAPRVRKILGL